jgi:hypothetical protein
MRRSIGVVTDALIYFPKRILAIAVLAVALAVPWYYVVRTMRNVQPVNSPVPARSVFWAHSYFNTPRELRRWLHRRGVAYVVWAKRHPPAAARIGS